MEGMKTVVLILVGLAFASNVAFAYQVGSIGAPPSSSNITIGSSFQTLATPFENFFQSLANSIGNQPILGGPSGMNAPLAPTFNFNNIQSVNIQTLLQEVDHWFVNLNLSEVVTAVLNGILWVLWIAQQFVQWLLSLVR